MTATQTPLDAAQTLHAQGFAPIPVPAGTKNPGRAGWQDLRLSTEDLPRFFNGHAQNIGILWGAPSGDIVDVDLDAPEVAPFRDWLLATGRIFGRPGNPQSHRLYHCHGIATTKYQDPCRPEGRTMLLEVRSTGTQTIVPPSVHPSGETIAWDATAAATTTDAAALLAACGRVAAAALLTRYWPGQGSRHDASLALIGMLLRGGWDEETTRTFVTSVAQVAGDDEWRDRGRNVATTARRLAGGGHATGAPTLARLLAGDGSRIVGAVRAWLGLAAASDAEWSASPPPAAAPATDWPAPLSDAAFYGLAGDIVRMLAPHTEADPAALLLNTLVMAGSAAGRGPHAWVGDTRHGTNLYAALVGETAKGRKGTSEGGPRRILRVADDVWALTRLASGLSSGEGLIHAIRDPFEREEPIKEKGRIVGYQTETVDAGVSDKRLLVTEGELASAIRVAGRDGNTLSALMRLAWDGETLRTLVKNNAETATAPHVAILGHITRDELLRYLDATESANGWANRFLWVCVKRARILPEGGRADDAVIADLGGRLGAALAFAKECGELKRDAEARDLWAAIYPDLSTGQPGLFGAVIARSEAQVLRLSLIYALLDQSAVVRAEHLLAALAVWDYCEASARYIFGDATGNPVADRILKLLRTEGPQSEAEIYDSFGRHVRAPQIDRALETLAAARLVTSAKQETGGRPKTIWTAA